MKRVVALLAVLGLGVAACNPGVDEYALRFQAAQTVATTNGPVTFTVAPSGRIYYADLRTNALHYLDHDNVVHDLFSTHDKPDALLVDGSGRLIVAARTRTHKLTVTAYDKAGNPEIVYHGPTTRSPAHLARTSKNEVVLGIGAEVLELVPRHRVISRHWIDPVVIAGRGDRVWVADNAPPGGKERVARGRETDPSHRNRFASVLPPYTNPSGGTVIKDEILLCSRTHKKVYRLHIGLDDVARRRNFIGQLRCDRDIGALPDGSVVTSTPEFTIVRYPPR